MILPSAYNQSNDFRSSGVVMRGNRIPEWRKSARGGAREGKQKSPTPDGMGLILKRLSLPGKSMRC